MSILSARNPHASGEASCMKAMTLMTVAAMISEWPRSLTYANTWRFKPVTPILETPKTITMSQKARVRIASLRVH